MKSTSTGPRAGGRLRSSRRSIEIARSPAVVHGRDHGDRRRGRDAILLARFAEQYRREGADAVLRAPFDGVITERHVHPGTLVGPSGTPVVRIEQVSRLRLTVPVPETYVSAITRGTRVGFTVGAFTGESFESVIARPAHWLDMKTRRMLVELDVDNARQRLAPGMFAEVRWPLSRSAASLFVPTTSVVRTSERQFVVRLRNGTAEWVDVRRGQVNGDLVEVFGELREGDVDARRGNDEIRPGSRVTATPTARR